MPRVRIHLNLKNPHAAESSIKLQQGAAGEHWPTIAYADHILLRDVVPVVDEAKHRAIVAGGIKMPMAFLEGELVAWSGRWRDTETLQHKELLRQQQQAIAGLKSTPQAMRPGLAEAFADSNTLQYNPKKSAAFYWGPPTAPPQQMFVRGARVAGVGWCFKAPNADITPMPPSNLVHQVRQTETERRDIPKGIKTTQRLLEDLDLSSGR